MQAVIDHKRCVPFLRYNGAQPLWATEHLGGMNRSVARCHAQGAAAAAPAARMCSMHCRGGTSRHWTGNSTACVAAERGAAASTAKQHSFSASAAFAPAQHGAWGGASAEGTASTHGQHFAAAMSEASCGQPGQRLGRPSLLASSSSASRNPQHGTSGYSRASAARWAGGPPHRPPPGSAATIMPHVPRFHLLAPADHAAAALACFFPQAAWAAPPRPRTRATRLARAGGPRSRPSSCWAC